MTMSGTLAWLRQATTGIGTGILVPTAIAYATGQVTGPRAVAGAVAGAIMFVWPEAPKAEIQTVIADTVTAGQAILQAKPGATTTIKTTPAAKS